MGVIAEAAFDLSYSEDKMWVRLYAPEPEPNSEDWSCAFEIGAPISVARKLYGVSSLQALFLAMKTMSAYLYGSDIYKNKELGVCGQFGRDLSIAAPNSLLDIAPYPF